MKMTYLLLLPVLALSLTYCAGGGGDGPGKGTALQQNEQQVYEQFRNILDQYANDENYKFVGTVTNFPKSDPNTPMTTGIGPSAMTTDYSVTKDYDIYDIQIPIPGIVVAQAKKEIKGQEPQLSSTIGINLIDQKSPEKVVQELYQEKFAKYFDANKTTDNQPEYLNISSALHPLLNKEEPWPNRILTEREQRFLKEFRNSVNYFLNNPAWSTMYHERDTRDKVNWPLLRYATDNEARSFVEENDCVYGIRLLNHEPNEVIISGYKEACDNAPGSKHHQQFSIGFYDLANPKVKERYQHTVKLFQDEIEKQGKEQNKN